MKRQSKLFVGRCVLALGLVSVIFNNSAKAQWYDFGNGLINLNTVSRIYGIFSISISNSDPNCSGPLADEIDAMNDYRLNQDNISDAINRINARPGCTWNTSAKIEFFDQLTFDRKFTLTLLSGQGSGSSKAIADLRDNLSGYTHIVQLVNAKSR